MIFYRPIILMAVLLFCSFFSGAQDNNYVYKDTAIFYSDSIKASTVVVAPVETYGEEDYDEYEADTILVNNQLPLNPDSIKALKDSGPFAYAKNLDSLLLAYQQSMEKNKAPSREGLSWIDRFFMSPITMYFFWILAAVFVSFILYKLFFTKGFFQASYARASITLLPDETGKLSNTADYKKLIAQAITDKAYRVAVRYHYLQSLQKLSLKGAIQYASDKTNYQYVNELSGKTYKKAFATLTRHYEYIWYGAFEVDGNAFDIIQNKFNQFNSEV